MLKPLMTPARTPPRCAPSTTSGFPTAASFQKQYLDMNMWLPGDILLKADKMCMAHSLELRVPFLDKKVMEFAEHIPANYRVNEEGCKLVLRHAANRTLPDEWATRKKVGFPVPVKFWLREQKYYDYVKNTSPHRGLPISLTPMRS
ncbi:MAG: asparagine synthase-related protein [Collinsella sp.]